MKATLDFTLHPSPNRREPLCLSAFQGVKGGANPSPTLHPPFTGNCVLTFSFLSQENKILPLPWQYFAPTRHKTKRRDRKKSPSGRLFFPVRESTHLVKEQIESPKTTNPERAKTSKKGEGWVKGGEGLAPPFTSQNPSVYRHFRRKGEG